MTAAAPHDPAVGTAASGPPTPGPVPASGSLPTPKALLEAPGYLVRRMYQAYVASWVRHVDGLLTGPQFAVLVAVDENPGADQGSLAAAVALDRSTMADIARRMQEKGLITRTADVHDGRRRLLNLTEQGSETLARSNARTRQLDEQLLAQFHGAERAEVMDLLERLSEHWSELADSDD